ncbi:MAG: HD-GYP domain-containing protein [Treponema sp.]|nr:HD-GYP domain-containing protein [Treponema sp.]
MSEESGPVSETPQAVKMKKYGINEIPPGSFFTEPLYLDKNFILAAPEMPFSSEMAKALKDWEFADVYSAGDPVENYAADTDSSASSEISDASSQGDIEKIKRAEDFYNGFVKQVDTMFKMLAIRDELNFNKMAEIVKNACDIIKEDRRYVLRAMKNTLSGPNDNYLASHSVKSTIISIIIGYYIKLPNHRLIELGVAALLHEIGMIKLPQKIYLSNRPLEAHEYKSILTHPVLGYSMLKAYNFPLTVTLAALEHHERENGTGYPRQLTGDKISLYAKVIAVACSYEALSAQRPHKEAKDGYTGMLELLRNEGKMYDDTIVRALVFSISIYPIGLYVLLSSGRKGQVVDVNPENPRFPIVQIFGELTPDGKNKVTETSPDGLHIVRPLNRDEIGQD